MEGWNFSAYRSVYPTLESGPVINEFAKVLFNDFPRFSTNRNIDFGIDILYTRNLSVFILIG